MASPREGELNQRSQFQFVLITTNLIAAGGIASFALKHPGDYSYALLLIPIISFVFFMFWVQHGIVIRLSDTKPPSKCTFWEALRRITFSIAVISDFILIPAGAVILYDGSLYTSLVVVDVIVLIVCAIFYGLWFYLQYIKKEF